MDQIDKALEELKSSCINYPSLSRLYLKCHLFKGTGDEHHYIYLQGIANAIRLDEKVKEHLTKLLRTITST